jgi:hypothetical protein
MKRKDSTKLLLDQMAKVIGTREDDDGNEYVDEDWDLYIPMSEELLKLVLVYIAENCPCDDGEGYWIYCPSILAIVAELEAQ